MGFLANMVKTVRTFGAAVVLIDQDLEAFIGVDGAQAESMAAMVTTSGRNWSNRALVAEVAGRPQPAPHIRHDQWHLPYEENLQLLQADEAIVVRKNSVVPVSWRSRVER